VMPMASTASGIHKCGSVNVALTREFFIRRLWLAAEKF
jgi:hypothetical protein